MVLLHSTSLSLSLLEAGFRLHQWVLKRVSRKNLPISSGFFRSICFFIIFNWQTDKRSSTLHFGYSMYRMFWTRTKIIFCFRFSSMELAFISVIYFNSTKFSLWLIIKAEKYIFDLIRSGFQLCQVKNRSSARKNRSFWRLRYSWVV